MASACHLHPHTNAARKPAKPARPPRRADPTRTVMLRRRYERAMLRRFTWLRARLALALPNLFSTGIIGNKALSPGDLPIPRFPFPTSAEKVEAFMDWLYDQMDAGILEVTLRQGRRVAARDAWQNVFVRSAYQRGLNDAYGKLVKAGYQAPAIGAATTFAMPFNQPLHADALGLLFTRNFEELSGITQAMGQGIARALTKGMAEGRGPRDIARQLNKAVDGIGIKRARVLARTEIIRAHAEASLNSFQQAGVEGVSADVEISTAGDDRVCEECSGLEGRVMSVDEARGILPVHVQCRCAWKPANVGE